MSRKRDIISVDFTGEPEFKKHVIRESGKKKYLHLSTYIKDVVKVHTNFNEPVKKVNV